CARGRDLYGTNQKLGSANSLDVW
nr:immunoglobulin heavy chain junction region [Macaca mulatta]MOW98534.1 immunoglobulin heavy chain junction region [Macaca mulatta]MOW99635.1 immunoglobulin heavy chain junction region [Macaca mulatta]MOW99663.1 immunoglobulin heavy chain junction region [Macaca mulatta]MOX00081.1 immunoglobulin heavy chain junction region [Macaca mulatta]